MIHNLSWVSGHPYFSKNLQERIMGLKLLCYNMLQYYDFNLSERVSKEEANNRMNIIDGNRLNLLKNFVEFGIGR